MVTHSKFIPYRRHTIPQFFNHRIGGRHFVTTAFKDDGSDTAALVVEVKELAGNVKSMLPKADAAEKTATEAKALATETKTAVEKVSTEIKVITDNEAERKTREEANQKALNGLIVEMKTMREGGITVKQGGPTFGEEFAKICGEHHKDLLKVSKGQKQSFEIKTGANMTTGTDLTGNPVINFLPKPALVPAQKVNFRDLVTSFQSNNITIDLFRENYPSPAVGAFAQQTTEGALKEQIEYQFTNVTFTARYISGFVRFAKQMMYNLPWLQTYLPNMLLRDFYKFENATFFAQLAAAATASTTTTGGNTAEKLIQLIANVEGADFGVNGITVPPALWAALMLTTVPTVGTAYSIPGGVVITPSGQMLIAGIPIIKATWEAAGTALVGDWTTLGIAQVENLKVEFFEQDSDNVERNLITARVEALEVLVIEQPRAFAYKTGLS